MNPRASLVEQRKRGRGLLLLVWDEQLDGSTPFGEGREVRPRGLVNPE
jgi:hypothetical protein